MFNADEFTLALRGYVISLATIEHSVRRDWRRKCWSLGALISESFCDYSISHVLVDPSAVDFDVDCVTPISLSRIKFVSTNWIDACVNVNQFVEEKEYMVEEIRTRVASHTTKLIRRQTLPASRPAPIADAPSLKACVSALSSRRSDSASARLNPNGVFRGVFVSIYGIDDARIVQGITHQIVDNGGRIVDFMSDDQYACICSDGVRPMNNSRIQLVSTRWVNDCLAHGEILEPNSKKVYMPSRAQLPLLLMRRISICTPFQDEAISSPIREIAKLCGIPCFDVREKWSSATHLIVSHPEALQHLPRALIRKAVEARKHIVSTLWLEDTFFFGAVQEETKYTLELGDLIPNVPPLVDM